MLRVEYERDGGTLAGISGRIDDLRPFFDGIVEDIRELSDERFRRSGPGWAPLSPEWRDRKPGGTPPGVFSGVMRRSFVQRARYSIDERGRDEVAVGSRAPHAHLFAEGRGRQPARPVLPDAERYTPRAAEALRRHLFESSGGFDGMIR